MSAKQIHIKNCLEVIRNLEANSISTVFADPPYQLGTVWEVSKETGKMQVRGKAKDFMSKWEGLDEIFLEEYFRELFRVMKYGGYAIHFGMDRQLAPLVYYAMLSGFETECQSLYWYKIGNFPKASNIAKHLANKLESEGEISSLYNDYRGGVAPLKQAVETVLVFRKPLKTGTLAGDIIEMHNGDSSISPAIVNIEANRVGTDNTTRENHVKGIWNKESFEHTSGSVSGRFPSNVFCDNEAAKVLDAQSGVLSSGERKTTHKVQKEYESGNGCYGKFSNNAYSIDVASSKGGCSKILHKCDYEEIDYDLFIYDSTVSPSEREKGMEDVENNHATLKPIRLNYNILKLFLQPKEANQTLLLPFSGSGSELIGAIMAGYDLNNITACEINKDYAQILVQRVAAYTGKVVSTSDNDVKVKSKIQKSLF